MFTSRAGCRYTMPVTWQPMRMRRRGCAIAAAVVQPPCTEGQRARRSDRSDRSSTPTRKVRCRQPLATPRPCPTTWWCCGRVLIPIAWPPATTAHAPRPRSLGSVTERILTDGSTDGSTRNHLPAGLADIPARHASGHGQTSVSSCGTAGSPTQSRRVWPSPPAALVRDRRRRAAPRHTFFAGPRGRRRRFRVLYEPALGEEPAARTGTHHTSLVFGWVTLQRSVPRQRGRVALVNGSTPHATGTADPRGASSARGRRRRATRSTAAVCSTARWPSQKDCYAGTLTAAPDYWGGWKPAAGSIEFWHGRPNRLHEPCHLKPHGAGDAAARRWTWARPAP